MQRAKLVFFSMPFGTKLVGSQPHDFDGTWTRLLKAAVPEGWDSKRIDEVNEAGSIPQQFKEFLRTADVVVFDLTSANPNVLYELGIRDVFAPGRRVLVARTGTILPFNISTDRVLYYDADRDAAIEQGFVSDLRERILNVVGHPTEGLRPTPDESRLRSQLDRAANVPSLVALWQEWKTFRRISVDPLMQLARMFSQHRRVDLAIEVARRAYQEAPDEWEIARLLGWYLRKTGAHDEAQDLLRQALALNPQDIEAMGILGGLFKRQAIEFMEKGDEPGAEARFAQSRDMYVGAIAVDGSDIYNLVNAGALAFIGGNRDNEWYRRVVEIVGTDLRSAVTWDVLAFAEACLALGLRQRGLDAYAVAAQRADFDGEMEQSASEQLQLLQRFKLPASDVADARAILIKDRPARAKGFIIVHLSDVHFGKKPSATGDQEMHRFRSGRGELHDPRSLAQHIVDECRADAKAGAALFIVISGDIAYQATRDEYEEAGLFVGQLLQGLELKPDRVIVVPGNHDVNWKLSELERAQRFDTYLTFAKRMYGETLFRALHPCMSWDFTVDGERPAPHQILSVHRNPESRVVFVGFNSCVMEDNKRHFGAVGKQQLSQARSLIQDIDETWIRVAVMHHHVLPLESRLSVGDEGAGMDATLVRDYSLVERELHKLGFDLVLHGHKHEPGVRGSRNSSTPSAPRGERRSSSAVQAARASKDRSFPTTGATTSQSIASPAPGGQGCPSSTSNGASFRTTTPTSAGCRGGGGA